jgi:hypothetical protein
MAKKTPSLDSQLREVLRAYRDSFTVKSYADENDDTDPLMEVFGVTPQRKRENRQYWGRELGMCWQLLVTGVLSRRCAAYSAALKLGGDEPCDCCVDKAAIDTKYRIGSGDSGTLKKFRANGKLLQEHGYQQVLLIVREDNLVPAKAACISGGWTILEGSATFEYIKQLSRFDLLAWLQSCKASGEFLISRM